MMKYLALSELTVVEGEMNADFACKLFAPTFRTLLELFSESPEGEASEGKASGSESKSSGSDGKAVVTRVMRIWIHFLKHKNKL